MAVMKLNRWACLAGLALFAVGCTSSDEPVRLSDGSMGYHIFCNGMPYKSKEDCLSRADMLCENGYTVLKEADPVYPHVEDMWTHTTRDIFVRCNDASKQ